MGSGAAEVGSGKLVKSGLDRTDGKKNSDGAESDLQDGLRQGVVCLLGMAVVYCLGCALVG